MESSSTPVVDLTSRKKRKSSARGDDGAVIQLSHQMEQLMMNVEKKLDAATAEIRTREESQIRIYRRHSRHFIRSSQQRQDTAEKVSSLFLLYIPRF